MKHLLYTDEDEDAPAYIKDRNGEVVLSLCRVCGQGEGALAETCPGSKNPKDRSFYQDLIVLLTIGGSVIFVAVALLATFVALKMGALS